MNPSASALAITVIMDALNLSPSDPVPTPLSVRTVGRVKVYVVTAVKYKKVYVYEVEVTPGRTPTFSLLCTAPMMNG